MAETEEEPTTQEEETQPTYTEYEHESIELLKEINTMDSSSTRVINLKDVSIRNTLKILDVKGTGIIRTVAVISASDFSMFIKADGVELYNTNSDFTTLSELSGLVDDVKAQISGANKQVALKYIKFYKSILIQVNADSTITAENIFCIYDIQQPTESAKIKTCST